MARNYFKYLLMPILVILILVTSACNSPGNSTNDKVTEEEARQIAENFVKNSPTFVFDGIDSTLIFVETLHPGEEDLWQFDFRFESTHAGYGDRTGQMLAEVITKHEAVVTVENGKVKTAVMDEKWDMINQKMIDEVEISLAPIHEVDVYFMESFPVQVGVHIKGGLASGCTTFHDAVVTRQGDVINIKVTVQNPKGIFCPAIYTYFEKNLNLGINFTIGKTYTLNVNDRTTTFTYY